MIGSARRKRGVGLPALGLAALVFWGAPASLAQDALGPSGGNETFEGDADVANVMLSQIEWVLDNNPVLMERVISRTIRENPEIIESIVRDTIVRNPDIVVAALQEFQRRQQAGGASGTGPDNLSDSFLEAVHSGDNAHVGGNPDGSITLTEFYDYNCEFCRAFHPILTELKDANPHLRVVYRDWPILGEESVAVARLSQAARLQGQFEAFHDALMAQDGVLDQARALAVAAELGLDTDRLERDAGDPLVGAHLRRSAQLAREVSFRGTPAMVIGDRLARGFVEAEQIQPLLDAARIE